MDANRAERGDTSTAPPRNITDPRSCLGGWRRWIRPVVYVIYGLFVAIAIPLIIIDVSRAEEENFKRTLAGVGFFAMAIAIPISIWGIINHIICFTRPSLQKYIIRILLMVPIYELNSWFALRFPVAEIYLDSLRQLYQAFVMYNFVYYLLTFYDEVPNFENRLVMKPQIKSPPPCCCIQAVPNQRIINRCKAGVLNYTVVRILVTIVTIITHLTERYKEGNFAAKYAYVWVTVIVSISQIWAIFCINLLRKATLDELKMLPRSTSQFVGIQLVIFVTNFQSTLLNILAQAGAMKPKQAWGFENEFAFATMLQDFLICLEMMACAILFSYSFDYHRYITENEHKMNILQSFQDMKSNIMGHLRGKGHSSTGQQSTDLVQSEQPPAADDIPPSSPSQSPTAGEVSPRRTQEHQFISLPDIILNHQEQSDVNANQEKGSDNHGDSYLQVKKPSEGTSDNDTDDFMDGDFTTDDSDATDLPRRPSVEDQLETAQVKTLKLPKRQKKISCSGLKMSFDDDDDISTNGDDVSALGKSDDDQIDTPDMTSLTVPKRRHHQFSDADMVLGDNDISSDDDDSDSDIRYRSISDQSGTSPAAASLPVPQRRIKKVSYAGMTFDDMDWYVIRDEEEVPRRTGRQNTRMKEDKS